MQSDRITRRAEVIRETLGVSWELACTRAEREFRDEYWTPWELAGSQYATDYLAWYFTRSISTVQ